MPKWTEYTSKDTLADNDEVMLYDATGKANKRGLMSKFWDYVVDKMSTAVISKLETNNKTIIGAINALNGDKVPKKVLNLSDEASASTILNSVNAGDGCNLLPVWGTIGGLYSGWAWGIVLAGQNNINFIGVENASKKLAAAQYSNGKWVKIL
ncbi:hypothetical protein [Ruminococcus sp. AF31-8BH]|uniref:hypothetical protein n=1 Tax=Ruminococcus sp. AF31-8BH TaxID=2293174 RepID=UPI000E4F3588|nr:hypothetical protein [Ruminococcus sp. AF31-8BH]RGF77004.1 hypothetical protein DWZ38_03535 [Ruminococcus sp. AF31-8BH]